MTTPYFLATTSVVFARMFFSIGIVFSIIRLLDMWFTVIDIPRPSYYILSLNKLLKLFGISLMCSGLTMVIPDTATSSIFLFGLLNIGFGTFLIIYDEKKEG